MHQPPPAAMSFNDVYNNFFAEVTNYFGSMDADEVYVWPDGFICDDYEFEDSLASRGRAFTTIRRDDWTELFPF